MTPAFDPRWRGWLVLPALVVLLPVGTMVALGRFDGLYGQDPFAYYDYAIGPLRASLLRLKPPPPFFWPPGYPLLVALISLAVGPVPLAGQLVSLIAGSLVPVFTALLAREVGEPFVQGSRGAGETRRGGDKETRGDSALLLVTPSPPLLVTPSPPHPLSSAPPHALVAGLLAAFTGQLWQSSAVVMADTTGLAAATLGVWALARYGRRGHLGWLMLAAVALAWAILARWIYGLVAIPCTLYALVVLRRHDGRTALVHGGAAALAAASSLAPVLLPAVTGLLAPTAGPAPFAGDLQVYTWHPLHALRREFVTVDGVPRYRLPNGLYYALAPAHRFYFTPPLAVLILPGLWAVVRRRTPVLLWLIIGWAAIVYGFHAGAPWQNFRFTLAYLPPLAILAAIGVDGMFRIGRGRIRWPVSIYLAVGLIAMAVGGMRLTQGFIDRKHDQLAIVRWVESQAPADARLVTFGLTLTFRHYSRLETLELFELNPEEMAGLLEDNRSTFLLLDVTGVEEQWRGRSPEVNYRWLREGPGLEGLGSRQGYTLFRVRRVVFQ